MSHSDFDNDGFDDLAIGVPGEDIGTARRRGQRAVRVGRRPHRRRQPSLDQNSAGVEGVAERRPLRRCAGRRRLRRRRLRRPGDRRARRGHRGDATPARSTSSTVGRRPDRRRRPDLAPGQRRASESGAESRRLRFGDALAVGDFNGDGFDDLAVGVPGEDVGTRERRRGQRALRLGGRAHRHGRPSSGTRTAPASRAPGGRRPLRRCPGGRRLQRRRLRRPGDRRARRGRRGRERRRGQRALRLGRRPHATGDRVWHQDSAGVEGAAESDDRFGESLPPATSTATASTTWRSACPARSRDGGDAGAVNVLYGSAAGLTAASDQLWHQDSRRRRERRRGRRPSSAVPWPSATSTATASTTWRSACPARTSAAPRTPARSTSSTARRPASAAGRATSSGTRTAPASTAAPRSGDFFGAALTAATSTATASTTWRSACPARTWCFAGRRGQRALGSASGLTAAGDDSGPTQPRYRWIGRSRRSVRICTRVGARSLNRPGRQKRLLRPATTTNALPRNAAITSPSRMNFPRFVEQQQMVGAH